nr:Retrovirus-related Pol polyprotein from transposon TNT 1-94 [Ipomoea batatas]
MHCTPPLSGCAVYFRCTPDEVSRRMGPLPPRALLRLLCASFWYAPASFPSSWIALCVVLDDLNSSQNVESLNCEVSWVLIRVVWFLLGGILPLLTSLDGWLLVAKVRDSDLSIFATNGRLGNLKFHFSLRQHLHAFSIGPVVVRCKSHGQNRHGGYNFKNKSYHRKWENNGAKHDKEMHGNPPKNVENACYRCGMTGHWEHTCCTARHLVDLYQASLKEKGKNIESNNVLVNDDFDITYLDVEDFLGPIEKKD